METTKSSIIGRGQRDLPTSIVVEGECFRVEFGEGHVFVVHPVWSLVGTGATLREAVQDMQVEAKDLADALTQLSDETADSGIQGLKQYLQRLI